MTFHSTGSSTQHVDFTTAILTGLASDGGLFVPDQFPNISMQEFTRTMAYPEFAKIILENFIDSPVKQHLDTICSETFNFSAPLKKINPYTWLLELFHGPTLSFKDFGARFLANCLQYVSATKPIAILVATSGDTGSAVAAAFHQKPNTQVIVLFPKDKISERQQKQITCWQDNVLAVAVEGTFDDCQRLVKETFKDPWWQNTHQLSTANSINIGRLLPQMTYYGYSSYQFYQEYQKPAGFIIPSGNLGHATAAYWAQKMGFPIREIVISTNANLPLTHYLETGKYQAFPSQATLANAMDVGNPSNFARLQNLFSQFTDFAANVHAIRVNDEQIKEAINQAHVQDNIVICPHTATAYYARQQLNDQPWVIAATADPSKFEQVIEPLLKMKLPPTKLLEALLTRQQHFETISPDLAALTKLAQGYFR